MSISIDPNGNIYIADTGNNRIQKMDPSGKVLAMAGGFGWGQEQFQRPMDICAENGLDVFVADYENRRIARFDKDLHWIGAYQFTAESDDNLTLGFPLSLSISIHGDLFVVDAENLRILKLNTLREAEMQFGDYDWGEGGLADPQKIIVAPSDRIYVSDQQRHSLVVYDYFGNYLFELGIPLLKAPTGIALDAEGHVFVADAGRHQILVFDHQGRLLSTIASPGDKIGALGAPSDVALFRDKLYVSEADNHRVQVFQIEWVKP